MIKKFNTLWGVMIIFFSWLISHQLIGSNIIPAPHVVALNFINIFYPIILPHLFMSLLRILVAIIISLFLGVGLGLLIGMNNKLDLIISPVVYLLYPVPKIAFLPVFMLLFGLGNSSKIILITVIVVFQIIVTTRDSVKAISQEYFYSASSLGLSGIQIYQHLVFPAILPNILTALRITVGTSIAVLFYTENFAAKFGIGYFIMNSWSMVNYVEMFSGIVALSLLGLALFKLIDLLEDYFCYWVKAGNREGRPELR